MLTRYAWQTDGTGMDKKKAICPPKLFKVRGIKDPDVVMEWKQ